MLTQLLRIFARVSSPTPLGCPPCREFTPKLSSWYTNLKQSDSSFEVVFVSSDTTAASFGEYFSEMPFLALPFSERETKDRLSKYFNVSGIPSLLVLAPDGSLIAADGKQAVIQQPKGDSFPWSASSKIAPPPPRDWGAKQGNDQGAVGKREPPQDREAKQGTDKGAVGKRDPNTWIGWMIVIGFFLFIGYLYLYSWVKALGGSDSCPESHWRSENISFFLRASDVPSPSVTSIASLSLSGKDILKGGLTEAAKRLAISCEEPVQPCFDGLKLVERVSERLLAETKERCQTYLWAQRNTALLFVVATVFYSACLPLFLITGLMVSESFRFVTKLKDSKKISGKFSDMIEDMIMGIGGLFAIAASVVASVISAFVLPVAIRLWRWLSVNLGVKWNVTSFCIVFFLYTLLALLSSDASNRESKRKEKEKEREEEAVAAKKVEAEREKEAAAAAKAASWQAALEAEAQENAKVQLEREARAKKAAAEKAAENESGKKTKKTMWWLVPNHHKKD